MELSTLVSTLEHGFDEGQRLHFGREGHEHRLRATQSGEGPAT